MKRFWKIALAALLVAVSTADVASACGLTRGLFGRRCAYRYAATYDAYANGGWSVGSTAGSVSRDLPTCSGGACVVEKEDDAAETAAPACSGGSCDVEQKTDAPETTPPSEPGETCPTGACETLSLSEQEVALGLRLVEAANRARVARKLPPLQLDERFADGARSHSRLMARWRSCFHRYPPTPEICAAWQTSPEAAVQAWTYSGGHAAILFGGYAKVAPGVAYDAEGRLYWTLRIW